MTTDLPDRARVVVIGGGVIGASVAYHLTRAGWTDVLLLEQGSLSCGTTWHAAGLVGYRNVGGVIVARTPDRMVALSRTAANAAAYDLECVLLTPDEAGEKWPVMVTEDLLVSWKRDFGFHGA